MELPILTLNAWIGHRSGNRVTDSQYRILKAAECEPDTAAVPRLPNHHQLVGKAVKDLAEEEKTIGGGLGRPSGARFRTYERLKRYAGRRQPCALAGGRCQRPGFALVGA